METTKIVILLGAVVLVSALPRPQEQPPVPIVSQEQELGVNGTYKYSYQTGDGISKQESGFLKNAGQGEELEAQVADGSYAYTHPDGTQVNIKYIADEEGFRPIIQITRGS